MKEIEQCDNGVREPISKTYISKTDIILGIQDVLIRFGEHVEWSITYDPTMQKWTITVENPSIHV